MLVQFTNQETPVAKPVDLAFIGCGGIARAHLEQGLKGFDDVRFVGWCDPNLDSAEARRAEVGGQGDVFNDAEKMLDETKPEAVYVMLPPFAHGPAEQMIVDRGLPFFVEKPVAIDLDTAGGVLAAVRDKGLITATGYMNRYRDAVQRVRSLVERSRPVMLHGGWIGGPPENYEGNLRWWVQKDKSGGQFLEQSTHTADLARYLFGDVVSVYAVPVTGRLERPDFFTIEDASMVQLRFANGAAGNLYSSCSTPAGGGVGLELWTTGIHAKFDGWEHSVTIDSPDAETITIPAEDNIFGKEDRAFVDAVKENSGQGILATYEDGYKAVQIACAANESMASGQVVQI